MNSLNSAHSAMRAVSKVEYIVKKAAKPFKKLIPMFKKAF